LSEIKKKKCFNCRQLTDSATGKDASGNVTSIADRFLHSVNDLKKAKMSMQNQWKLLSQLKDYLNKANYDKNQPIIVSKDWLDSLQKLTYSQLETIRKLSSRSNSTTSSTTSKTLNTKHKDSNDLDNVKLMPEQIESLADLDSITVQRKTQQVIIHKLRLCSIAHIMYMISFYPCLTHFANNKAKIISHVYYACNGT